MRRIVTAAMRAAAEKPLALASVFALAVFSAPAEAKIFRNAYVSFELPPKWECALEGTEWVCRSTFSAQDAREAIIILTAKEVGPTDNLSAYEAHLKTPKTLPSRDGKSVPSQVLKVQVRNIANHPWVDGMHLGSEVPNYYTRYMATVKDRVAILVTFSAHKLYYTKYSNDFFRAIESLRTITTKSLMADTPLRPGSETLGVSTQGALPTDMGEEDYPAEGSGGSGLSSIIFAVAIILAAAGVYLLLKKKQTKKRR